MLAEQTDYVIGVDTHRDRHSAAVLAAHGGLVDETSVAADWAGYAALLGWAHRHAAGRRVWAIGSDGEQVRLVMVAVQAIHAAVSLRTRCDKALARRDSRASSSGAILRKLTDASCCAQNIAKSK